MGTIVGAGNNRAHSAHMRFARILALVFVGVIVTWLTSRLHYSSYSTGSGYWPLWFAYVIFAVAIGDLWESLVAIAVSAAITGRLLNIAYGFSSVQESGWARLLFVLSSAALIALVHRRRHAAPAHDSAVPLVSSDIEDPVLIIRGHAQILQQGTGIVFDTRQARGATTAELAGVRVARGSADGE